MLAGAASVCGYQFSSPYLADKCGIHDTCGVGNLHGYPSLVGSTLSLFLIALDPQAEFLAYDLVPQMVRQFLGIVVTLVISIISGYGTGVMIKGSKDSITPSFLDKIWWHLEY